MLKATLSLRFIQLSALTNFHIHLVMRALKSTVIRATQFSHSFSYESLWEQSSPWKYQFPILWGLILKAFMISVLTILQYWIRFFALPKTYQSSWSFSYKRSFVFHVHSVSCSCPFSYESYLIFHIHSVMRTLKKLWKYYFPILLVHPLPRTMLETSRNWRAHNSSKVNEIFRFSLPIHSPEAYRYGYICTIS